MASYNTNGMSSEEVLEDLKSTAGSEAGAADAIVALDAACKLSLSVEGRCVLPSHLTHFPFDRLRGCLVR